ncbi:MAG: glycosyltransferase family 4 protein [Acidimicrobiales bacterium]
MTVDKGLARELSVLLVVEQLRRSTPGGIGTYAAGLVSGMNAIDAEAIVAGSVPPRVTLYASRRSPDPLSSLGRPLRGAFLPSRLLTRAWDREVMTAPSGYHLVHGISLATPAPPRRGSCPVVITVHDLAWRRGRPTTKHGARWHEAALERALSRARAFVVPSLQVARDLVEAGASETTVTVIPEGCDHMSAPDTAGALNLLSSLGVEGPYLLAASTLEPRKNLRRLLAAYGQARSTLSGLPPLVLAGPRGWGDPGLDTMGSGVVVVGRVPDPVLSALYRGAACFLYVSLSEGFGLPPLEAMACGVPVITSTTVPSVVEVHGEPPAVLVEPEDTDAICAAIVRVVQDGDLAADLVRRGAELARQRTWASVAQGHVDLWKRLC